MDITNPAQAGFFIARIFAGFIFSKIKSDFVFTKYFLNTIITIILPRDATQQDATQARDAKMPAL